MLLAEALDYLESHTPPEALRSALAGGKLYDEVEGLDVDCAVLKLKARPGDVDEATQERGGIFYVRVPETTLELGLTIDWHAREIKLLLLGPLGAVSRDTTSAIGSERPGQ